MPSDTTRQEVIPENLIFNAGQFGFYYLGSPYTDPNPDIMERRAHEAWRQSGLMTKFGIPHYCPIHAKHQIAKVFNLPVDVDFWWNENLPFLHHACGMIIAVMPGWQKSRGIDREMRFTTDAGKPLYLTDTDALGLRFWKI